MTLGEQEHVQFVIIAAAAETDWQESLDDLVQLVVVLTEAMLRP
jgi:hypothetical protein